MRPGLHARSLKAPESLHGSLDFYLDCGAKVGLVMFPSKHYHINCYTIFFCLIINEIQTSSVK